MRPASEVWRDALDATGAFVRFKPKPERAAIAIIEADRKQVREEVVREIADWVGSLPDSDSDIWADEIERKFLGEKA